MRHTGKGGASWQSVALDDSWLSSGVHDFTFNVDKNVSNWLFIGVATRSWQGYTDTVNGYVGHFNDSWGFCSFPGWGCAHASKQSGLRTAPLLLFFLSSLPEDDAPQQRRTCHVCGLVGSGVGNSFKTGDVVQMTVDMDAKTVAYAVNGKNLGVCHKGIVTEVCPAITLYHEGDQVTLA